LPLNQVKKDLRDIKRCKGLNKQKQETQTFNWLGLNQGIAAFLSKKEFKVLQ